MKKRFLIILLVMIITLSALTVAIKAVDYSVAVSMTANNSRVSAGNEVLITVKLSNLNVGDNGINGFSAYLSYDTEMFETLTDSSVDGINGWVPNYTPGTGKVSLYRPTFLKTDEEIMQISLKVKSGVADGTQGEVKLSTIIVSNSSDQIMATPVSTMITVGNGTSSDVVQPAPSNTLIIPLNTTPTPVNNTANVTNTAPTNTQIIPVNNTQNNVQVTNESDSDMPYTGNESNALARIIVGVVFIGLVMYIKIVSIDKDIR